MGCRIFAESRIFNKLFLDIMGRMIIMLMHDQCFAVTLPMVVLCRLNLPQDRTRHRNPCKCHHSPAPEI